MGQGLPTATADTAAELERVRSELEEQRRRAEEKERQLERYASDLRETFKAERARAEELRVSYLATVRALVNAVEARDAYTGKHAERVAAYGLELARRVDPDLAADPQAELGFLLHDVGKIAIPDGILHKVGNLAPEEKLLMRRHTIIGFEMVQGIAFLSDAAKAVRHHHERYDGSGHPDGLAGDEIPLVARILTVVDALDAITTDRPYRPATTFAQARESIREGAGTQFDPMVVGALETLPDELLERVRAEVG
jgi:putative nucleotidyltransferase with HDIG domain